VYVGAPYAFNNTIITYQKKHASWIGSQPWDFMLVKWTWKINKFSGKYDELVEHGSCPLCGMYPHKVPARQNLI